MTIQKPNADAVAALKAQLAGQLVAHHVGPQAPEVYDAKPTNIVYASNGIFRVIKTPIAMFKTKLGSVEANVSIPGNSPMEEGTELLVPKIPFKYWLQVLSYYKDVHEKDKTEASVVFFWNHNNIDIPTEYESGRAIKGLTIDGQLIVYCPEQKNSSGLSDFTHDTMVPWLRARTTPLLETHSHHTMGAFWSGTDNANENMTQFYGVYGKITSAEPEFLFRFVSGEHKINISFWNLFDKPRTVKKVETSIEIPGQEAISSVHEEELDYKGPWPMVQYPDDWMEQHSKSWAVSTYQKGPTQSTYGRGATPSNGVQNPYQNWPGYDDYEDGYYGGPTGYGTTGYGQQGGARRSTQAGNQTDVQSKGNVKKNNVTEINPLRVGKRDEEVSDVLETDSSYIEIIAAEIMDNCDAEDIKMLLKELCDYGYDYVITDLIKEQGDYRYNDI